jgi:outer membrane protein assembly factor BamB
MLAATVAPALAVTVLLGTSDWPMYGHDPKHTFRSSLLGPTTNNLLSPTPVGNIIYSQATVTADGVFIFGAGVNTFAVRADGELLWKTRVAAEASFSTPTLDSSNHLYVGGRDNQLWKKRTGDGSEVCRRYIESDGDIKGSPTISVKYRDRVYVTSDIHVYAIATEQTTVGGTPYAPCALIWMSPKLNGVVFSSVSLADSVPGNGDSLGHLVVAAGSFVYLIQDHGTHATIVKPAKIGKVSGPTPLIHPTTGNIYVGSTNRKLYGFTPGLVPLPNFPVDLGSAIWASASLSHDGTRLYVPTDDGKLHAVNAVTGQEAPGFPYVPPTKNRFTSKGYAAVVDGAGNIYMVGQDKWVRALRPGGTLLWQKKINGKAAAATIVDGGLIVPGWDHNLYRFCRDPTGPATALNVCGYVVNTTVP